MATEATKTKTKTYILPFLEGVDAPTQAFYSHNGRDYILKRGEAVELPEEVYDYIVEQEKAKLEAIKKARSLALKEPSKN
jgi:hypothetical protein